MIADHGYHVLALDHVVKCSTEMFHHPTWIADHEGGQVFHRNIQFASDHFLQFGHRCLTRHLAEHLGGVRTSVECAHIGGNPRTSVDASWSASGVRPDADQLASPLLFLSRFFLSLSRWSFLLVQRRPASPYRAWMPVPNTIFTHDTMIHNCAAGDASHSTFVGHYLR